jgi:hypothetical protein
VASWDYPQIGMTQDAIILTANCYDDATNPPDKGNRTLAVAKALLYNGGGYTVPFFSPTPASSNSTVTLTPPVVLDQNPKAHLLTDTVHNVTFTNPQAGFFASCCTNVAITGFYTPHIPRTAGQPGCTTLSCTLDTLDGRFVAPSTQYGDHLWNVATYGLNADGGIAIPSWGDFDTEATGANTTKQLGRVYFDACSDDFNASLVARTNGRVWINFSSTDPPGSACGASFARMLVAGRRSATPVNTMTNQVLTYTSCCELTGDFDSRFGFQRWGDTSSVSLDPSAATVAWAWNETVASSSFWGTRAQKIDNN